MKKLILGLVAVGALIALRPVVKRRMAQKMREHCKQMATEHCEPLAAEHEGRRETVAIATA